MTIYVRGQMWQVLFWPWFGFSKGEWPEPGGSCPLPVFRYWCFGPWKVRRFSTGAEDREAFARRDAAGAQ